MFFWLSKTVGFALTPSNAIVGLLLLGLAIALFGGGWSRSGVFLATGATLLLLLGGYGPAGNWFLLPLEERFPSFTNDGGKVDGIVVLGGALRPNTSFARNEINLGESGERLTAMADLARRFPGAKLVFTGGSGALIGEAPAEAVALKRFAPQLGLDPDRIVFENRSRTTWENAARTRELVSPAAGERWLLVTSAWHMPRSVGVFRKAGFDVTPYPVDYQTIGRSDLWRFQTRLGTGLDRLDAGAREWLGLLAYRLSGRSTALFPGPD